MGIEIERKFLVSGDAWRNDSGVLYRQGYLNRDKARTVRIRIAGGVAFLTIKGKSTGATRAEFEYPVPLEDAQALLALCDGPLIEKTRYVVLYAGHRWEVDEFASDNAGLVVAELELSAEDEAFEHPAWLGAEVTHDARYFNSNLAAHPFSAW
ncbi:MAG: CYTH domain-containing protein [Rhodoferax sp.]|uniref:CYTH domain-containing protein n=1 Tax=Rhodoferax sp. TaxID=50421 RepID=UPI002ACE0C42|nr:CYTH domain-containing protein [Rhodoferax sp.]MDZ7890891.1 CYTH domain-containing protein [Rhodoferax sp.]